jgi:hypothetical protein
MALFGPDARARRRLFVGVKRTSLKNAPRAAFDPSRTFGPPAQSLKQGLRDALLETLVELGLTDNWQHMIDTSTT